jgi:histidine kinase
MKVLSLLQQKLSWKLFLSYLVVILVGAVVLAATAQYRATAALDRHIAKMEARLGDDPALVTDLQNNFRTSVNDILATSAAAAFLSAVAVSVFTARRIVDPVRDMMDASQHIAAGDYHQRVRVPSQDELGSLARSFNRMAETLEQTEQRRMALIGDVAHELRTPLSSIKGVLEGLLDGVLPVEPRTLLSVQREVSRLQTLVADLEELSRTEAGRTSLHIQRTDLPDLIRGVVQRLAHQFNDKGVRLNLEISDPLPPVQVDAGRMTQVILNLLGNALQYTPPGGQVTVRAASDQEQVRIVVEDTGIGIAAEHLPHLFERFYRVDKSRSRVGGGSGIGLTIAKHLVEAHGGEITAESAGPDQGSTFSVILPHSS